MARRTHWASLAVLALAVLLQIFSEGLGAKATPATSGVYQYKPFAVKTPDGLTIRAQIWGNAGGPEILFIHGFSQSYLSWIKQTGSGLSQAFRMVTYDLRGHGGSDKPSDAKYYQNDKAWADEVAAVIQAAGLKLTAGKPTRCAKRISRFGSHCAVMVISSGMKQEEERMFHLRIVVADD